MEFQSSLYLTKELKTALKLAYHAGKSLGSTEKEAVELLDALIGTACSFGSSDLHLQNLGEMRILVKFRVDGELRKVTELPPNISEGILSRLKYITHMQLDSSLPQDGRFATKYQDKEVVVRISIIPTRLGEDAALRILAETGRPKSLEELGLNERDLGIVKNGLERPYGMILACGPTSSGKTATVYNMIGRINREGINICTVEDPVEYVISGVRQLQIDSSVGFNFGVGLRAILRHDPDIIFVGEIRDRETAEIAVDAALTGHLLLSTLHANSAPKAITRLRDLDCRPYLLAATLNIAVAQRLVKTICQECKVRAKPQPKNVKLIRAEYGLDISKITTYKGKGCDACQGSGYRGRTGIFEALRTSVEIKELILANAPTSKILEQAKKEGFTTMFEDGLEKAKKGIISLPDLLAATG